jgi:Cu/Ag efflux pump CusA
MRRRRGHPTPDQRASSEGREFRESSRLEVRHHDRISSLFDPPIARLVVVVALIVLAVGLVALRKMPVDVYPEIMPVTVTVHTEALGLSAEEIEQLVTVPIEADLLTGTPWVNVMRSESVPGLSSIELEFKPGTDPMHARQVVQERLTQAHALPNVSKPPRMLQPMSSTNRLMLWG